MHVMVTGKTVIHASISGPEFALINNTVKFVVNIYPLFNVSMHCTFDINNL